MAVAYRRNGLDDVELHWIKRRIAKGRPVERYWAELSAICDEFSVDLTSLMRDYETCRSALRVKYRARDVGPMVWDLSEGDAKRKLIELVGVARKLSTLSETLMHIAVERAGKARKATAAKGALGKLAADPKQVVKHAASDLWPEASRKGWTAVQFHAELVRRGHAIAPDTARKWLTSLRKTGTC